MFLVDGKREPNVGIVKEGGDTFRREGCLAGLGEGLRVVELRVVEK